MPETIERLRARLTSLESDEGAPRSHSVSLRVTVAERRVLDALADVLEVNVADLLRPRIGELMEEADRLRKIAEVMDEYDEVPKPPRVDEEAGVVAARFIDSGYEDVTLVRVDVPLEIADGARPDRLEGTVIEEARFADWALNGARVELRRQDDGEYLLGRELEPETVGGD